jgi:hypothetical protein
MAYSDLLCLFEFVARHRKNRVQYTVLYQIQIWQRLLQTHFLCRIGFLYAFVTRV